MQTCSVPQLENKQNKQNMLFRLLGRRIQAASYSPVAPDFFPLRRPRAPAVRLQPSRHNSGKRYNVPISAEFVARVSGIATMGRLPFQETADGLDAAFVGVPIDTGTSNRPGARCCKGLMGGLSQCRVHVCVGGMNMLLLLFFFLQLWREKLLVLDVSKCPLSLKCLCCFKRS